MSILSFQKALGLLAMPVGVLWLLLILLVAWCWWRRHLGTAFLAGVILVIYSGLGNIHTGHWLMTTLESRVPVLDPATTPAFDAIAVLGGGSELDAAGKPQLGSGGDRILQAARWYHAGKARVLIASGCSDDDLNGQRDLAQETRQLWHSMGIPDAAIVTVGEPCWITRDEIAAYRTLVAVRGWKRLAVVSSAWHLPRAMALAESANLSMTPLGADWRGRDQAWRIQDLVPCGQGFLTTQLAYWEYLGRWVGR